MNKLQVLSAALVFAMFPDLSPGQSSDSIKVYNQDPVYINAKKHKMAKCDCASEKDQFGSLLELGGFSTIRKGVFLAQDIYADGLKRDDYPIVIDGERYHSACPMRMDAPISRVNPLDIETLELVKSSSNLQSGLGGLVAIHRSEPQEDLRLTGSYSLSAGHSYNQDVSLQTEMSNMRGSFRFAKGSPYQDGYGRTFKDLYGYKNNTNFLLGEATFYGVSGLLKYSGSLMYSADISFPYLQMDERTSKVYNASFSYDVYKLYFNYTDHVMNNGLRVSPSFMETSAKNLTIGLTADFFELYYRHWNADNKTVPANPKMSIFNNALPKLDQFSANIFHEMKLGSFDLTGKLGGSFVTPGNKSVMPLFRVPYPGSKDQVFFPTAGLSVARSFIVLNDVALGTMVDIAAESPEAQALYINIKRMTGKPTWIGNPTLHQPVRTTLRTNASMDHISLDLYGSYISQYVYLASASVGTQKYQTYGNVNAVIAGATVNLNYDFIEVNAAYTYGENKATKKPLMEISPLHISTKLTSPELYHMRLYVKHTYEDAQLRVDKTFGEVMSSQWNSIDAGLSGRLNSLVFSLDVENIGNFIYSRHLSYARDPFASGLKVYEPGTVARINLRYYYE